ncbi:MAG: orotidine-5'-phosphate decarboxylase [Thiohalophilus sp.]|uniref:orotidine-5'-phosphate decarboxylase n=1 Tax=Thiohalophilus sp. TaxID=3028392 RepID=UPI00287079DA|nr:orotidine-5'-phosphate decarboxylase [Thiohalophilus sp.]MDR9437841.1 orotidine-5'-phosphate decarboxylase [Thiohalophilus sp.]
MSCSSPVIVALDYANARDALAFADNVSPERCRLKVGKELFTAEGPQLVRELVARDFEVFLDLKFHDIPNTVAKACAAAAELGVWMLNVHTLGGSKMMTAARDAVAQSSSKPLLIGVTILTSMGAEDLQEVGLSGEPMANVEKLATLAANSGLDGVVCSPREVSSLRQKLPENFQLVTPGIRPAGSASGDQTRIMTPAEAIGAGSNYLVIGRPITQAEDPMQALTMIEQELETNP